jgi:hypothetical protein
MWNDFYKKKGLEMGRLVCWKVCVGAGVGVRRCWFGSGRVFFLLAWVMERARTFFDFENFTRCFLCSGPLFSLSVVSGFCLGLVCWLWWMDDESKSSSLRKNGGKLGTPGAMET